VTRTASRRAWSVGALALTLIGGIVAFDILNRSTPTEEGEPPAALGVWFLLLFISFVTVGALIASRRPDNPIGWLFCALGLLGLLVGLSEGYALYSLRTRPDSLPGGELMAWLAGLLQGAPPIAIVAFALLLFPNGRLLSFRWRPVVGINLLALVLVFLWSLEPGPIAGFELLTVTNPLGVEGAGPLLQLLGVIGFCLMLVATAAGVISLVLRFRRSRGEERQQLKWFAWAGGLFCSLFLVAPVLWATAPETVWMMLFLLAVSTLPIATGIGILKHRLYDIDVVINRTLVYGSLTAILAGTYFGFVLLFQLALNPITEGSELAVAASTLAVAALFRPARRRIQAAVDRRFYRRKYDAARTLEAFSSRLREEIDLEALRAELTGVVRETMQPDHVSLWMREGAR
jgi:hypothetical protein